MGLAWSYKISHACNLPWQLKNSSSLTRFEINCKINMKGVTVSPAISKWQQWQLANAASSLQPGIAFSTLEHSLTFCFPKSLGLLGLWVFSLCLLILILPLSPLPIRLQNKESNLGTWSRMTAFDVVQMSFRCRFGCRSDPWVFQETSLLSRCRPVEKGGWTTFLFGYCCL